MIAIIILDLSGRGESDAGFRRSRCTLIAALGFHRWGFFLRGDRFLNTSRENPEDAIAPPSLIYLPNIWMKLTPNHLVT